eukprot:CAMPEP_0183293218 /NCGR_PEP_ID=MMETSP0160_2-20130417/1986_1 /TAXON_ID=2839 ORGANISM="Odontella Sinensis, Strain Grunow 1884" /NCGR_SAMPLE_ID=MMETSP0160_2 /ASSEMBLY_ACC=CAM_ASM_000250 /LENGTH=496 /DNA_ID=CAMNT_0025454301 /DNA_START=155 /DNA_END=1645 /DNA_ORIENTATION=+
MKFSSSVLPLATAVVVVVAVGGGGGGGGGAAAFSPARIPSRSTSTASSKRPGPIRRIPSSSSSSSLNLIPGGGGLGPEHIVDHHAALSDAFASASQFLADAATATADVATDAAKDGDGGGWWQNYLNLFKSGLVYVHSSIDGPLRSVGFDQTWGVSIAIFTAAVRSLLVPLSVQQSKSSEYVKALKPYQDEIKEKFKDRKELQNRAVAKLYEDAGTNPLTGCLISLSQIPIFLGLYRSVTLLAREGQLDERFLWIPSLQGPVSAPTYRGMEWLTQGWTFPAGGFPTPSMGWETTLAFLAMPVILVLGQSFTMSTLTPETDTSTMSEEEREQFEKSQGILKFLPLLIGYFSLQVPAGLTIYWLTSNAFTLTQSLAVKAYYKANPPKIDLPDYWDALDDVANMSPEERRKAAEAGINAGPKFEDLLDEAQFHYVVERVPLREGSDAWERASSSSSSSSSAASVPAEMASWVSSAAAAAAAAASGTPEKREAEAAAAKV